jgi:hypothetical protein
VSVSQASPAGRFGCAHVLMLVVADSPLAESNSKLTSWKKGDLNL